MLIRSASGIVFSLLINAGEVLADPVRDCPSITSNLERLACFDQAAGTPARVARQNWSVPEQDSPSVQSVMTNEVERAGDDLTFRLRVHDDGGPAHKRLVISAPAIAEGEPRPYLAISCVQNISRLQLISPRPIEARWVRVQLQGERGSTLPTPWQVMENGQVLDAGRGLPAIEQIKQIIGAERIHVVSEHADLNGLSFDAQGLDPLIEEARRACRW